MKNWSHTALEKQDYGTRINSSAIFFGSGSWVTAGSLGKAPYMLGRLLDDMNVNE